ncbi:MAG: Acetyltransferase (GNAT) family protein [Alphaproteobacteria bacterium ADurb.Bin438]|nr:MAG: Acetyltransferase (GNAT) family protein [Alphaproteobacteria bacterium ADurb.Bin438]
MDLIIKKETVDDYFAVENLTREAFFNIYMSGCDEHLVVRNLRNTKSYINELSLVAFFNNELVGHIMLTRARVEKDEVLCLGPISVLPKFQSKGIGSKLMKDAIKSAKNMGFKAIILLGNPDYYSKFGFKKCKDFEISLENGQCFDALQILHLSENNNIKGRFIYDRAFVADEKELEEYEKLFPYKEKTEPKIKIEIQK